MKYRGKKQIALLLVAVMALCSLSGFTYYNGLGTAYYDARSEIFDDVTFGELIAAHNTNGIEHAYYVEANPTKGEIIPIVYNGEVRSTYTLASMIQYAEKQGFKVVAGINGDIFDMSSGTPKGLTIHQGNIVTSGYAPDRVMAFDADGSASIEKVSLAYTLKGTVGYMQPVVKEQADPDSSQTADDSTAPAEQPQQEYVTNEITKNIDFFNVPFGAAKGLHLFNRHYASSTKTSGQNAEVVVECSDIQLQVNKTIKGIIKSVNANTANTPITDNTIVLSTVAGSQSYDTLASLVVGSEVEISVEDMGTGELADAQECIGIYYSLAENGRNVTVGGTLNPRSALGIKNDGSVVLFEVDGRTSASKGLGLSDLGDAMIDLGCSDAVNLDGGGSSVLYVREAGKDLTASRKNTPSEGSERKVANAILFVYKDSGNGSFENLNLYPQLTLMMPGASAQISAYASDDKYEKVNLNKSVSYSVDSADGTIGSDGIFTASETANGRVKIQGKAGGIAGETEVEVTKDINIIPSVYKLVTDPGKQTDINITATAGSGGVSVPVKSKDSLFTWTCDSNVGTITQEGVFTAASEHSVQNGNIYVSYNGKKITIPVQVGANITVFSDTADHWAKQYIGVLASMGIINGMGDNVFAPENPLTRAQFVALLAKMTDGYSNDAITDMGFKDVPTYEWYYGYVNWAAANGIVSGMGDGTFAPDAKITREQMGVMLCNYATYLQFVLPQNVTGITFNDSNSISPWAIDYVMTVAGAGIINGYDTGDFKPSGTAKRAEAATVIYKLCEIRGMIQ